ncbi:MAG: HD domain-containing protein [Pirellulaceae bacterium]|nr:HD domain-containing protein [Pirellulaceae bacterium]
MSCSKLRRQIAWQAARLMYDRDETEYYRAKIKAARKLTCGWVKPSELPSNAEIRDEIELLARQLEGTSRQANLLEMRIAALGLMLRLERYSPRLIGSVLTGHIRRGSDIDLHIFSDSLEAVTAELEYHCMQFEVERKRITKKGETQTYRHIRLQDGFQFELTVYPVRQKSYAFKSSITGKPIEKASIAQFSQFLSQEYPNIDLETELANSDERVDRFQVYAALLLPLENFKQNPKYHPEGDALYHSLQVYDLACDQRPYDEEFLLAALLHDVGKGIDSTDHVNAGLEALEGFISERTAWLIENHMLAHAIHDHSIGARKHRRLRENESYAELLILGECDRQGRRTGVITEDMENALAYIREISESYR